MGSRSTLAPNADTRRATSRQRPPRRLRFCQRVLAQPRCSTRFGEGSIAWVGDGSDDVCTLAGRLDDALLLNEAITDKALRQASVAERPVALPPVHPTEGSHPWPHCFSPVHKLIR